MFGSRPARAPDFTGKGNKSLSSTLARRSLHLSPQPLATGSCKLNANQLLPILHMPHAHTHTRPWCPEPQKTQPGSQGHPGVPKQAKCCSPELSRNQRAGGVLVGVKKAPGMERKGSHGRGGSARVRGGSLFAHSPGEIPASLSGRPKGPRECQPGPLARHARARRSSPGSPKVCAAPATRRRCRRRGSSRRLAGAAP